MATQIPEEYSQLLDKLQANLVSKTETLNYDPMSASTLKSAIAKALRPSYDKAIETRNRTAATNRAMIDADAAARGIGASTWVTDVKNRQNDAAASDIANLESDYSAKLYENLLNRLTDQENKKLTVDQFNAQAKQNALSQALGLTDKYWEKWGGTVGGSGGSGSGGGSGGSGGGSRGFEVPVGPTYEEMKEAKVQQLIRNAEKYLADLDNPNGGKAIYNPTKVVNANPKNNKKNYAK